MEISVQRKTAMKVAALYNPLEKFLGKYLKNDFNATEEDLIKFYTEQRIEAGKDVPQSIEPVQVEVKASKTIVETPSSQKIEQVIEESDQPVLITIEVGVKKKPLTEEKEEEQEIKEETKPTKVIKEKVKLETKPKVGKVVDITLTPKMKSIIDSEIVTKSQKVRLLYNEGVSLGQISRELKVYYSFAKVAIFREFKRDIKLLPEVY